MCGHCCFCLNWFVVNRCSTCFSIRAASSSAKNIMPAWIPWWTRAICCCDEFHLLSSALHGSYRFLCHRCTAFCLLAAGVLYYWWGLFETSATRWAISISFYCICYWFALEELHTASKTRRCWFPCLVFLSQKHDRYGLHMFGLLVNILYAPQEMFNMWFSLWPSPVRYFISIRSKEKRSIMIHVSLLNFMVLAHILYLEGARSWIHQVIHFLWSIWLFCQIYLGQYAYVAPWRLLMRV